MRADGYRYDHLGRHPRAPRGSAYCKTCRVLARAHRFNSEGLCQSCELAESLFPSTEARDVRS
jgi:hypothetical protein